MSWAADSNAFDYRGAYRVQSWRRSLPSRLSGQWIFPEPGQPSQMTVNAQLMAHPHWFGDATIKLRAAAITGREGAFSEPDILYKSSNFVPADSTARMTTNIVDVRKAAANWRRRVPLMRQLLGERTFDEVATLIGDVERVAADEYMFHEAGHCLGYSTAQKYRDGYFRIGGTTRWPLIYAEELRADLLAFHFAAAALPPQQATALLLYNVLLRVSADIEASPVSPRPYGFIPSLLLAILGERDWLFVVPDGPRLRFASLNATNVAAVMTACGERAISDLVVPERDVTEPVDVAIHTARWLKVYFEKGLITLN